MKKLDFESNNDFIYRVDHIKSVAKLHPVNLALLQEFFNSTSLDNITGNSMFAATLDVDMSV